MKPPCDRVLEEALALAAIGGWYDLSLSDVSEASGMTLNEVRSLYADTNAIADAWFARALDAMLVPIPAAVSNGPVRERLDVILWRWFQALADHHRISADMITAKLHLPHAHHWVPAIFDVSRLVQMWRDAAGLRAGGRRRQIEEIALTAIFLATLRDWCRDHSPDQEFTRNRLARRLDRADELAARWYAASPETEPMP